MFTLVWYKHPKCLFSEKRPDHASKEASSYRDSSFEKTLASLDVCIGASQGGAGICFLPAKEGTPKKEITSATQQKNGHFNLAMVISVAYE